MHRILDISKKPIPFSRRVCLVMLFVLCSLPGFSQNFPVQVIPQTIPPAPIYVSSYADANTLTGPLRVQIILNDFEIANREIRLKTYFTGSGLNFQSNDIVVGASPLFLEGGVPLVLTHVELAPYFEFNNISGISPNRYGNAIPEGAYQFCVEVYDALTGSRISQRSCAVSVVFQNEPPFLVLPRNKTNVDEVNPQYIVFQWTPRSINVSNVAYELSLVEIWDTQVDPQQAFLSSPPVFQTTTRATTYVYGPADPLLLSGKNYAWRVQAKAKQGLEEIGLFKNQGYSEIFSFSYAGACDLPIGINHEVKGSTNANIFWDDFSTEIPEYTVRYRKKGNDNEWFESKTAGNFLTLWNLRPDTIYEYQLRKKCSVTESDWSFEKQFTTFLSDDEDSIYECGIPPNFDIGNKEPLQNLGVNEEFTAGDFPIKVLEASGSNGRFTGKGYVTIPYLRNIRVGVEFTNVLINSDRKLLEGSVNTMYDPSLGNILDIDDAIDTVENVTDSVGELFEGDNDLDEIQVDWTIGSKDEITIEDGMVVITNPNNGVTKKEPLGDDMIITDQEGNTYYVSPEGEITEGGQITPGEEVNPGKVTGVSNNGDLQSLTAENIKVTFNSKGTYGLDQMPSAANTNEKLKKEYTIIKDATGGDYVLPHHAVKKGGTTQIQATIEIENNAYTPDQVIFKNKQGKIFTPTSINGNTATISLDGVYSFENETIYAVVPSKEDTSKQLTAGAFTLWHLTDRAIDVVLVSVDKASIPNDTETTIKNIFGTGITTINIDSATASLNTSLLGTDGQLEIGDSPWLVAYNEEQKAVIGNLKSQIDYSTDKYYLFVFKNSVRTTKPIAGFMPLQRQFGFLFNGSLTSGEESKGDLGVVASHEIGHGVFALQHPFTQYGSARESTDWLMDSKENEALLSHMDWSQMHDPALKFYLFQDEEDGELLERDAHLAITKTGKIIDEFYLNRKKINVHVLIASENFTVESIKYQGVKYMWDATSDAFINGERKIKTKKVAKFIDKVNVFRSRGDNCTYDYALINWNDEDENSNNLVKRILEKTKDFKESDWKIASFGIRNESCDNIYAKEVLDKDRAECSNSDIQKGLSELKKALNGDSPKIITVVNNTCLTAIKNLGYSEIQTLIDGIAKLNELKELEELAIIRLINAINGKNYPSFYQYLENENNKIIKHLISEIDDASVYFWSDQGNYTNFIGALVTMFNEHPNSIANKWPKNNSDYFKRVVNLVPRDYEFDTNGLFQTGFSYRKNSGEYNENSGDITVYDNITTTTYSNTGFSVDPASEFILKEELDRIGPLTPLLVVINSTKIPLIKSILDGYNISDNSYVVPAIFLKYNSDKIRNTNIEKGIIITLDGVTIVVSGGTAIATKVHWVKRAWAMAEIAGSIGSIGLTTGVLDSIGEFGRAVNIFNSAMAVIGLKNGAVGLKNIVKNLTPQAKQILLQNKSLRNLIAARYFDWQVKVRNLDDLDDGQRLLITQQEKVWKSLGLADAGDDLADVALITSSNISRQNRINVAVDFLKGVMGKKHSEINNILEFVDLSKGVSVVPLKEGDKIWRFERKINPNVEKHFFTDAYGADSGVRGVGFDDPRTYELVTYEITKNVNGLKTKIKSTKQNQFISKELGDNIKEINREPGF